MDQQFTSQLDSLSEDTFNELMDIPSGTPGSGDLLGSKKPDEQSDEDESKKAPAKKNTSKSQPKKEESEDEEEEDDDDRPKGKTKKPVEKSQQELEDEIEESFEQKKPGSKTQETAEESNLDSESELLKAKAMGLIERGIWKEFDGMEDFEWTEDNYGELTVAQANWSAQEAFEEMIDQTGDYGKAIFQHIKNGGDPKEIVTLFKEAKRIESYDISDEGGQERLVREYYKNVLGWSDIKINRLVNTAIDNKELKSEAEEVKTLLDEEIKKQVKETAKAQEEYLAQQKDIERAWADNITKALKSRDDISDKEKRAIHQDLLAYNQKLGDGRVVNKFTIDFMELQKDPQKYIDLVLFVQNPEKYIQRIAKTQGKEEAKKAWSFIKGNGSLSRTAGTSHTTKKGESKEHSDLIVDYKSIYKQ